jgi:Caspase domain
MATKHKDRSRLHALLIAADCYLPNRLPEGSYPNLAGCARDIQLVDDFLRDRLGLKKDRLIKLTSTDGGSSVPSEPPERRPTYENIIAAFKSLAQQARAGDSIYIHYSGHGGRTPTLLPQVKGDHGIDEALVPVDIGASTARYVRDVELAKLIRDMVAKGLRVTMVLDCCHSGGATRGTDSAVRGVAFIGKSGRHARRTRVSLGSGSRAEGHAQSQEPPAFRRVRLAGGLPTVGIRQRVCLRR